MAAMSRRMFCRHPLANRPAACTSFPGRRGVGSDTRRREKTCASMQPKPRVQYLSAVRLAVRSPAGHAEPYLALLSTPIGKILASRLPEHPEDVGFNLASRYGRAAVRAVVSSTRMIE